MQIFEFKSYRAGLEELLAHEKKLRGARGSMARLAEKAQIQPSYLTNAMKLRAHLSSDQIYSLGEVLGLNESAKEFLSLLMEWERASHAGRKADLRKRLDATKKENIRVGKHIKVPESPLAEIERQKYYLDPNIELMHLYLGTENAPTDTAEIAKLWGLPEQTISDALVFLQKSGLVKLKGKKWISEAVHQHLPRESPLCKPQQMLMRLRAMETLQKIPRNEAYTFAATVTMTEEVKFQIQARFIEFLKETEKLIRDSRSENIYQIQFDLFPWLNKAE